MVGILCSVGKGDGIGRTGGIVGDKGVVVGRGGECEWGFMWGRKV